MRIAKSDGASILGIVLSCCEALAGTGCTSVLSILGGGNIIFTTHLKPTT